MVTDLPGSDDETVDGWTADEARETPVSDGCIYCKCETAADDRVQVGVDEYLCKPCRNDLREFNRFRKVDIIVSGGLLPATKRIVMDHWEGVQSDLARQYESDPDLWPMPRRQSDANHD